MKVADFWRLFWVPGVLVMGAGVTLAQENLFKAPDSKDLSRALESAIVDEPLGRGGVGSLGGVGERVVAKSDKRPDQHKDATEVVAMASNFDNRRHIAVFVGEVTVNNPQFTLTCDKLTAHLKNPGAVGKEAKGTDGKAVGPAKGATASPVEGSVAAKAADAGGGGLEKAVAEADSGKRVHIVQEKKDVNGAVSRSVGEGRMAVYVTETEEVTLTGMPWIQQGLNTVVSLDESTIMILTRDGRMSVQGPHKSVIKDGGAEKPSGR